jgi:hypothetical protein
MLFVVVVVVVSVTGVYRTLSQACRCCRRLTNRSHTAGTGGYRVYV